MARKFILGNEVILLPSKMSFSYFQKCSYHKNASSTLISYFYDCPSTHFLSRHLQNVYCHFASFYEVFFFPSTAHHDAQNASFLKKNS